MSWTIVIEADGHNGVASKGDDLRGARALTFEHESLTVSRYLQIINSGESATMNCTVEGYPVESVEWLHDGVPVLTAQDTRIRLLAPLVLMIGSVGRKDKGMYQCLVRSDKENAQATAELKLGGVVRFYTQMYSDISIRFFLEKVGFLFCIKQ